MNVQFVQDVLDVSERRVCRVLGQPRSTQRYKKCVANDEEILTARIVALASEYGRYGYRRITAMLRQEGWQVNHKKVERLWREEGLQLPQRHKKRRRLYHKDSSIIRLRPTHPNHVWAIDFVHDKHETGRFRFPEINGAGVGVLDSCGFNPALDAQLLIAAQTTSRYANALYGASALDLPRRGVAHAEGGMGAIAGKLVEAVRRNGGQVHLRQEVTRIAVERRR